MESAKSHEVVKKALLILNPRVSCPKPSVVKLDAHDDSFYLAEKIFKDKIEIDKYGLGIMLDTSPNDDNYNRIFDVEKLPDINNVHGHVILLNHLMHKISNKFANLTLNLCNNPSDIIIVTESRCRQVLDSLLEDHPDLYLPQCKIKKSQSENMVAKHGCVSIMAAAIAEMKRVNPDLTELNIVCQDDQRRAPIDIILDGIILAIKNEIFTTNLNVKLYYGAERAILPRV